jgi:uncharacterized protein YbjT (DUF2867 family)
MATETHAKDRLDVVTGVTGHTGREVAETLLAHGKRVRVIGRNLERLRSTAISVRSGTAGGWMRPILG